MLLPSWSLSLRLSLPLLSVLLFRLSKTTEGARWGNLGSALVLRPRFEDITGSASALRLLKLFSCLFTMSFRLRRPLATSASALALATFHNAFYHVTDDIIIFIINDSGVHPSKDTLQLLTKCGWSPSFYSSALLTITDDSLP